MKGEGLRSGKGEPTPSHRFSLSISGLAVNESSGSQVEVAAEAMPSTRPYLVALLLLSTLILSFSIWANMSWEVQNPQYFQYFPPFRAGIDRNMNKHLGAEYLCIAQAIVKGRGFADPFHVESGPTAWMPPMLCLIEAFFLWLFRGDLELVMVAMVILQNAALITTTWLMLVICGVSSRLWIGVVIICQLVLQFHYSFQMTHDCGFLMLVLDGVIAGLCFAKPFSSYSRALLWGAFGGFAALSSPIVGFVWFVSSMIFSAGNRLRFAAALGVLALVLTPWIARNYMIFGKFIPVKSNLAYELYQTQCLQGPGIINPAVFSTHPWAQQNDARRDYCLQGEMVFLEGKRQLFMDSVRSKPGEFLRKVSERFWGVMLIYVPEDDQDENAFPLLKVGKALFYALPFISWCILFFKYWRYGLSLFEKVVFWVYILYFIPYILISYYSRYEYPAHAVKWILIVWLGEMSYRAIRHRVGELWESEAPIESAP